jgi:hypothetical protein
MTVRERERGGERERERERERPLSPWRRGLVEDVFRL